MPGSKAAEVERRDQIVAAAFLLARRGGLRAVTIRDVAARAGLSPGLVMFHFGSKDQLVLALLDWVLATTTVLTVGPETAAIPDPLERLVALLRQEMARLSREPRRIRLFFEFWNAGIWNKDIRTRMKRELDRYREAFRPMCEAALRADPGRFGGVSAAGLTAVAVGFIKGCAVQSMIEPDLAVPQFLKAAERLLIAPGRVGASNGARVSMPVARSGGARTSGLQLRGETQ